MNRSRALELLRESTLSSRYRVTRLALFGSTARGVAREDSDVDVLVAFHGPATSQQYFGVQFYLEDVFGHPVDLVVTEKALRPQLRPFIEKRSRRCLTTPGGFGWGRRRQSPSVGVSSDPDARDNGDS